MHLVRLNIRLYAVAITAPRVVMPNKQVTLLMCNQCQLKLNTVQDSNRESRNSSNAVQNTTKSYVVLGGPTARSFTGRLHGTIVGPTGRSDWSVRLVGPTIVSFKRFVRPVGQTVGRIKHV